MSGKLTEAKVDRIIRSFLQHIADYWDFYRNNLPHLRRTMMFYNEFAYGIRYLPENNSYAIEFNPKDPLLENLSEVFGKKYTEEIGDLVYGAWPLRTEGRQWDGYEEPIPDTPEALQKEHPRLFATVESARHYMYELEGTGYGDYKGERVLFSSGCVPNIWFKGFTTVEEFPAQKKFLDNIRKHPRIKLGIKLMEKRLRVQKIAQDKKENARKELDRLIKKMRELDESGKPVSIRLSKRMAALFNEL